MRALLFIATMLACSTFAQAQTGRPNRRQGFWIVLAWGTGLPGSIAPISVSPVARTTSPATST